MATRFFVIFSILAAVSTTARSENLHQRFGAGWDCSFITTGLPYKDLCISCEQKGMEFDRQGQGGSCVPKGSPSTSANSPSSPTAAEPEDSDNDDYGEATPSAAPPAPTPPPPPPVVQKPKRWNAVAGVTQKTRKRVRASVGYAEGNTPEEAKNRAVEACSENGIPGCKALGAWDFGCVYITTGTGETRRAVQAGYTGGATLEDVINKCRAKYDECKPPIGGCVE